jgi:hypothetical protein
MANDFADEKVQELLGELGGEVSAQGQGSEAGDLLRLTHGISRREVLPRFQFTDLTGAFETLGEEVDQGLIDVVD